MLWAVLSRIGQIVIAVRNMESALDHYARMLGRVPAWKSLSDERGLSTVAFRLGDCELRLMTAVRPGPFSSVISDQVETIGEGLYSVLFTVSDVDLQVEAWRSQGIEVRDTLDLSRVDDLTGKRWSQRLGIAPASALRELAFGIVEEAEEAPKGADEPSATAVASVSRVAVRSDDPEEALRLCRAVMGGPKHRVRSSLVGRRAFSLALGSIRFDVVEGPPTGGRPPGHDYFSALGLRVADLEGARERLLRQGFELSEIAVDEDGARSLDVLGDTHGVELQLTDATE